MQTIFFTVTNDLTYDQRMIRICTTLAESGYRVILVGRQRKQSKPLETRPFEQKRLKCWFDKGKWFYLEYNIRLLFYLLFQSMDAICSIDLDTILAGYYVSKWKKVPCIYDAHEYFTEVPEVVLRPRIQRVWERIAQHCIPKLSYCYTVCESLKQVFEARYGTKFEVIRNVPFQQAIPANTTEHPKGDPSQNFILLYQGVLNDGRGLEEMIAAMPQLVGVELWLAGEGDCSQALRDLVQTLKVADRVRFLGYLKPAELKTVTLQAHLGINLLKNKGLNYYYSLANKFFDYIQAEKPSLNMNFPEYASIIQKHPVGLLLDDLEPSTIIKAVEGLKNDPTTYSSLEAACRVARDIFVWEQEKERLLSFYKRVLEVV